MNATPDEVKGCFIKNARISPTKEFETAGILIKTRLNLEETRASVLLSACRPWLLTKRPSIQIIKALRGPVVVVVQKQVHVRAKSGSG